MSPWWKHRTRRPGICMKCRGLEDVHDDLCRHCRAELMKESTRGRRPDEHEQPLLAPHQAEAEPAHDGPWVHRGGA